MGRHNKIISLILAIPLIVCFVPSFGQKTITSKDDVHIGTVYFKVKSSKLTREAKAILDTLVKQIQNNSDMQVRAISSSKDFCDKCNNRGLKRVGAIMKYFSKKGVLENRLASSNVLNGESDNVEIYLTVAEVDSLHPNIKQQNR